MKHPSRRKNVAKDVGRLTQLKPIFLPPMTVEALVSMQLRLQERLADKSDDPQKRYAYGLSVPDGDDLSNRSAQEAWKAEFRTQALALVAEVTEALEWTPWKPWRKGHARGMTKLELENARLEVIDALCFLLNLWLLLGGTSGGLEDLYTAKMRENFRRAEGRY